MSGSLAGLVGLIGAGANVLLRSGRSIGTLIPHVVVEEEHRDDLVITEHPVERGAPIADHAFKRPAEVVIRAGWTNSKPLTAFLDAGLAGVLSAVTESYATEVYEKLLALQASREPFDISTGKRRYRNMLIGSLITTTTRESEYALMVTAVCREVIIVQTQSTTLPPQEQHASPAATAPVQDAGTRTPVEAPRQSLLLQGARGLGLAN